MTGEIIAMITLTFILIFYMSDFVEVKHDRRQVKRV